MPTTFEERLDIDEETGGNIIYNEHLVRYQLASSFVKGKRVLDIACGSGYGSKMLAEAGAEKVIAMDASAAAIKSAKKNFFRDNIEYRAGDAENIGLEENTIDVAVSFETIEHLKNADKFLKELSRVVKDDGVVMISTPNKAVSGQINPYHHKEYTKEEFTDALSRYFPQLKIVKQYNAISTFLRVDEGREGRISVTSHAAPVFFVAICSKIALPDLQIENTASFNPVALENLYNNPGFKLVNSIYSFLMKIPGMKRVFKVLKKI